MDPRMLTSKLRRDGPTRRVPVALAMAALGMGCVFVALAAEQASSPKPVAASQATKTSNPPFEDFVGAEACARCHQREYDLWKSSTHGRAGGLPHETKVIARFDGKPLRFKDATITPTTNQQGGY